MYVSFFLAVDSYLFVGNRKAFDGVWLLYIRGYMRDIQWLTRGIEK